LDLLPEPAMRRRPRRGEAYAQKVRGFGLFNDTSAVAFRGERLALNVVARACRKEGHAITVQFPGMET